MDVVKISLDALIQRITNPQNVKADTEAMVAFCFMLEKESDGVQIATKLLATYIQSTDEKQALQSLVLLDVCMKHCGRDFRAEIGKFRFLNELIMLVSPKFLGDKTPASVREKVISLLHSWHCDYPRETKIKEAYEMLKKQGIVKKDLAPIVEEKNQLSKAQKVKNALFEDEETAKLLQELLQSKDPFELQLANKLIKSMVKDEERRMRQNSEKNLELNSVLNPVHVNVKLLSEMLDSYNPHESRTEDIDLMKELYQSCEKFKPSLLKLAGETQDNEDVLGQILAANDELGQVVEKYSNTIGIAETSNINKNKYTNNIQSLLDLLTPCETSTSSSSTTSNNTNNHENKITKSDMEMLDDIFNSIEKKTEQKPLATTTTTTTTADTNFLLTNDNLMEPVKIIQKNKPDLPIIQDKIDTKAKAMDDLNEMGQSLLQQSLTSSINQKYKNINIKMNLKECEDDDLKLNIEKKTNENFNNIEIGNDKCNSNDDDLLIDAIDNVNLTEDKIDVTGHDKKLNKNIYVDDVEIKPLTDIHVTIEDIKPSSIAPLTVIDNKNGISVILHFTECSPRPDVTVIVITTMSKNGESLSNYLFQAVVPKKCKCRLEKPSGTELPAHNPFLPPSAITQIMLIANPQKVAVSLKFMLSYTMNDETYTEMGEVDQLRTSVLDKI